MKNVVDLEKIVSLALCSGYIEGDKPLSILVISDRPESGKTDIIKRFSETPGVKFASDISGYGIKRDFLAGIMNGTLHHIIIPEFLQPLMKGRVSAQSFTTTLQVVMEDGCIGFHTGFVKSTALPPGSEIRTVGVIGCMPRPLFTRQLRYEWAKTGFLSRWLIVTYKYNDDAVCNIIASIERGDYIHSKDPKLVLDGTKETIVIPAEIARACTNLALGVVNEARQAGLAYGFREIKHIRALVASNVIYDRIINGSERVTATMEDFKEVERLGYLFNEQFNEVKQ